MTEKRFELLDETIFDNQKQAEDGGRVTYWVVEYQQRQELVELLNEQDRKINILQNSWEIMNQRLSERSKCDYKKAIIEFCKFMNINTPLLDVMVDEFLQEII